MLMNPSDDPALLDVNFVHLIIAHESDKYHPAQCIWFSTSVDLVFLHIVKGAGSDK